MQPGTTNLPIDEIIETADAPAAVDAIQEAYSRETAVYPIGGGTSLDFGLPPQKPGCGLSLTNLNRVIDYPARDMTITVEAGITMQSLAQTLAGEKQQLPVDVPSPKTATLGGVVVTNFNGPRRYGHGLIRDHVIGVTAIDGRGREFHGGGRVVKNVAGYDFCKLLTGSMGTLGVITQMTLKVKPLAERNVLMACVVEDAAHVETILASLTRSKTSPVAIEWLTGPAWRNHPVLSELDSDRNSPPSSNHLIVVGLEGASPEVEWMRKQLSKEWEALDIPKHVTIEGDRAGGLWREMAEFPVVGEAPLVLKATLRPSGVAGFVATLQSIDGACSVLAHAGSGVVFVRFSQFPADGLSRTLVGRVRPAAAKADGHVIVLSNPSGAEMTRQAGWGAVCAHHLMAAVKNQFDPKNILNPGRFVV